MPLIDKILVFATFLLLGAALLIANNDEKKGLRREIRMLDIITVHELAINENKILLNELKIRIEDEN